MFTSFLSLSNLFETGLTGAHADIHPLTLYLSAAALGFLSSLTPCVYPLIPITLSIFGATPNIARKRACMLSALYVLGIASTYTTLGIFSAKSGAVFGSTLGSPLGIAVVVTFLTVLALFSLDLIPCGFVCTVQTAAGKIGGAGPLGAFLMGTMSGVVAAPCIGPVLALLLAYVAAEGNSLLGGSLLFTYALGLGFPFLVLGTFSGLINKIPRAGNWLLYVKIAIATLLFASALFILQPVYNITTIFAGNSGMLVLTLIGSTALAHRAVKKNRSALKLIASLLLSVSTLSLVLAPPAINTAEISTLTWHTNKEAAVSEAVVLKKIVMIDLFADWCVACKELDQITFHNPVVSRALQSFALARIDFTNPTPYTEALSEEYSVLGLPCVLFLTTDGKELPDSRITGFVGPEEFAQHLGKLSKLRQN